MKISKEMYAHPIESECFTRVKRSFISQTVQDEITEFYNCFDEQTLLPDLMGKTVIVSEHQFKKIHEIVVKQAAILEMEVPRVHVFESFYYDVNAEGLQEPWIQISAKTIADFSEKELEFVIGRQMHHIKNNNFYWEALCEQYLKVIQMGTSLTTEFIGFIPGVQPASQEVSDGYIKRLKLVFAQWSRVTEYSADRCGYLMCNDITACVSAIKKLVLNNKALADEMRVPAFIQQADVITAFTSPYAVYSINDELVPYGPFRVKELLSYASGSSGKECIKNLWINN